MKTLALLFALGLSVPALAQQAVVTELTPGMYSITDSKGTTSTVTVLPLSANSYSVWDGSHLTAVQVTPLSPNSYTVTDSAGHSSTITFLGSAAASNGHGIPAPVLPNYTIQQPAQPNLLATYTTMAQICGARGGNLYRGDHWYSGARCMTPAQAEAAAERRNAKVDAEAFRKQQAEFSKQLAAECRRQDLAINKTGGQCIAKHP